jgi:hypothetical protein
LLKNERETQNWPSTNDDSKSLNKRAIFKQAPALYISLSIREVLLGRWLITLCQSSAASIHKQNIAHACRVLFSSLGRREMTETAPGAARNCSRFSSARPKKAKKAKRESASRARVEEGKREN